MSRSGLLGPWVKRFLLDHLIEERNLSRNTQRSYRDTLKLLLPYATTEQNKPVDRLDVFDLSGQLLRGFLDHLEQNRKCSVRTRNQRLAAVHAMARFIAERSPEHIAWCSQIRAVPFKRFTRNELSYMDKPEMDAILAAPDLRTSQGRRDHALLLFLYNSGARVTEAASLRIGDLNLIPTTLATYNSEARAVRYAGARFGQQPSTRCSPSCATALPTSMSSSTGSAMQSRATVSTGCFATMSVPQRLHLHPCFAGPSARTPSGTQPPRIYCAPGSISTPSAPGSDTSPLTRPTSTPKSICNAKQKFSPIPMPSAHHPQPTSHGKTTHLCSPSSAPSK
jgi:site-specific recombinase XerC